MISCASNSLAMAHSGFSQLKPVPTNRSIQHGLVSPMQKGHSKALCPFFETSLTKEGVKLALDSDRKSNRSGYQRGF